MLTVSVTVCDVRRYERYLRRRLKQDAVTNVAAYAVTTEPGEEPLSPPPAVNPVRCEAVGFEAVRASAEMLCCVVLFDVVLFLRGAVSTWCCFYVVRPRRRGLQGGPDRRPDYVVVSVTSRRDCRSRLEKTLNLCAAKSP
jgi:hypothetical protein